MTSRFSAIQLRDVLLLGVPLLLVVAGLFWLALRFVDPAPPKVFVISAASKGSPYHRFAERYRSVFEQNGVKLEVRESTGSFANLAALADPAAGVHAGFVQGGLASSADRPGLVSLGRVAYEPLWVFHREGVTIERLSDLKGKRVLVGPAGGGTNALALKLLAANGVTGSNATLINRELPDTVDMLANDQADAGFLVLAPEARTVQRLLRTPGVKLLSFTQADAYTQRFPYLSRLVLRQGVVDFATNIPPNDVTLIATTAAVLVREDAHRALVNLLAQALQQVHGAPQVGSEGEASLFNRVGEFPNANDPEFALSDEARRVYRSGPPFLQRYLPFWLANLVDRLVVSLVVLLPLLIPLARITPAIYRWRVRRRILRWYSRLKELEAATRAASTPAERAEQLRVLDSIENAVDDVRIPLGFADQFYQLREHIEVVRRRLTGKSTMSEAGPA